MASVRRLLPLALCAALGAQAPDPPFLTGGAELRLRSEAWNDILDHWTAMEDQRIQYRLRTRLWGTLRPWKALGLTLGLNNESRHLARPDVAANTREVVIETLRLDWAFHPKGSLALGRQDLQRGEGFILFDGTPLDGSRTAYVNALDLAWRLERTTLELIALSNPRTDQYLPRLNEAKDPREVQQLSEWDTQAVGAYVTHRGDAGTQAEGYALHATATGDVRAVTHPLYRADRRLEVLGARLVRELAPRLTFTGEATFQGGREEARPGIAEAAKDIRAWGGYLRLRKGFDHPWKPSLSLGGVALSGDDPATPTREGWEPLLSRWPKWSELLAYSQIPESGVATWTNLVMGEAELRVSPRPWLDLKAAWLVLGALESWSGKGAFFGPGRDRGDLWILRADLTLPKGFKAHALAEHLQPGSFTAHQDPGYFLRFEVSWRIPPPR